MRTYLYVALCLLCLLQNGCVSSQKKSSNTANIEDRSNLAKLSKQKSQSILQFMADFSEMSQAAQTSTLNAYLLATKNLYDIDNRIKLAAIYALPTSRLRDDNKALTLFDETLKNKSLNHEQIALINILKSYVLEHQKLQQKLSDEIKRSEIMSQKSEASQQKLDLLQTQNKALEQKLEALKNIEKTMLDRNQGVH